MTGAPRLAIFETWELRNEMKGCHYEIQPIFAALV
jgi:hypothetical protein